MLMSLADRLQATVVPDEGGRKLLMSRAIQLKASFHEG